MPRPRAILESFTITSMAPGGQDFRTKTLAGGAKPISSRCLTAPCPPRISSTVPALPSGRKARGRLPPDIDPVLIKSVHHQSYVHGFPLSKSEAVALEENLHGIA